MDILVRGWYYLDYQILFRVDQFTAGKGEDPDKICVTHFLFSFQLKLSVLEFDCEFFDAFRTQCWYCKTSTWPLIIELPFLSQFTGEHPPPDADYFVKDTKTLSSGPFRRWELGSSASGDKKYLAVNKDDGSLLVETECHPNTLFYKFYLCTK